MRRIIFFIISFASFNTYAQQGSKEKTDENYQIILKVNGKEYLMKEGEEIKLENTLVNPVVSARIADFRFFRSDSVSFSYPRNFSYKLSEEDAIKTWTLDGNDCVIMYFEFDVKVPLNTLIEEMVKKFSKENTTSEDYQRKLGSKLLKGKRLNITMAGVKLTFDLLEIKLDDGKTRFIAFQDTVDNSKPSDQMMSAIKLINATIRYNDR